MLEDQKYILDRILEVIDSEGVEAVLIAGDIYDKPVPPTEAVRLFDDFLVQLADRKLLTFVISGNHDSSERIAFASRLLARSGIYVSPAYRGEIEEVVVSDEYGEIAFYLIPFIKPAHVRHFYPEETIENDTDALRCVISHLDMDTRRRNVVLAHQFVIGASKSGSEELSIGGLDEVEASVFQNFDYAALGHIHGAQRACGDTIRYSGTPLKYSFSEAGGQKSVTIVDMKTKGEIIVKQVALAPLRDLIEHRGTYREMVNPDFYSSYDTEAYTRIVLTDEEEVPNAFPNLRTVYPNLMQMEYDNTRTRGRKNGFRQEAAKELQPEELFAGFYENRNAQLLGEEQRNYVAKKIEKIWMGGCE